MKRESEGEGDDGEYYSYEELIAEIGALLLCMEFKIYDTFLNTCSYLKSWLTKTEGEDQEEILRSAFSEALKAKKYLLSV